jgi:hypothetical protein
MGDRRGTRSALGHYEATRTARAAGRPPHTGDWPIMKEIRQRPAIDEPVGIIISRGSREEVSPRVSAYIWGPVPAEDEAASRAA